MSTGSASKRANAAYSEVNRGPVLRWTLWLSVFVALSSFAGALEMLLCSRGNVYLPASLLDETPFRTFTIPGLLLGRCVGGSSAASAIATARGLAWRADAGLAAGGILTSWVACEVALLRTFSWLQVLYGGLGVALLALAAASSKQPPSLR